MLLYTCEISAGKLSVCQDLGISIMTMRYEDIPSFKIRVICYQVNIFCKYIFFLTWGYFLPSYSITDWGLHWCQFLKKKKKGCFCTIPIILALMRLSRGGARVHYQLALNRKVLCLKLTQRNKKQSLTMSAWVFVIKYVQRNNFEKWMLNKYKMS